ncbi:MAG: 50S ribosomal protein L25/general stress protein Ctc [Porticoccaceae bacterium]|jgi:large subunit ribosomal protein L25
MVDFVLNAKTRDDKGKGASRRLRRLQNQVPAIIYGGKTEPQNISLGHFEIEKALENEAFYSHIITINVEGSKSQEVIIKDIQRHPAKSQVIHMDFLRVDRTQKLHTKVPLHFLNEDKAKGVKAGGIVQHTMTELDIQCLPQDLPEFIEVDVLNVELGQIIHISDIKLPKGVESTDLLHGSEHDLAVASIIKPRGGAEETENDEDANEEA